MGSIGLRTSALIAGASLLVVTTMSAPAVITAVTSDLSSSSDDESGTVSFTIAPEPTTTATVAPGPSATPAPGPSPTASSAGGPVPTGPSTAIAPTPTTAVAPTPTPTTIPVPTHVPRGTASEISALVSATEDTRLQTPDGQTEVVVTARTFLTEGIEVRIRNVPRSTLPVLPEEVSVIRAIRLDTLADGFEVETPFAGPVTLRVAVSDDDLRLAGGDPGLLRLLHLHSATDEWETLETRYVTGAPAHLEADVASFSFFAVGVAQAGPTPAHATPLPTLTPTILAPSPTAAPPATPTPMVHPTPKATPTPVPAESAAAGWTLAPTIMMWSAVGALALASGAFVVFRCRRKY